MRAILLSMLLAWVALPGSAIAQPKIPILLDFDVGEDIDDVFALATVLASPELDLRGVTTVGEDSYKRAQMACRFLEAVGSKVPVAAGLPDKTTKPLAYWQVQYGNHASVYFRDPKPVHEMKKVIVDKKEKLVRGDPIPAPEFLYRQFKANPGELTIIAIGPLTNIAALLEKHPDCKTMIKRIVLMGGSVRRGYDDGSKPQAEYNIAADPKAAQAVFRSGVPLVVAPLDATAMLKLDAKRQKKLFDAGSLLTLSVQALVQLWQEKNDPILYDPVAVTLVHTEKFCTMENLCLEVDDKGFTKIVKDGKPNARVATAINKDEFLDWLVDRLTAAYPKSLPSGRIVNEAKIVPRGNMPNRVHAFEDFETDIEKRWWLAGRIETKNVPTGSKRALRAVLTQDFDDRQAEMKTLYSAVVFNPVPGPPMGKKPHLSFRYYLKGTDVLRVQIYSLTNGYHRCLTLKGLEQGKWLEGNVNMQDARKPDATGGPLSEDERIDDIQFYCDPRAELLIDDIVLYDAAHEKETRPFPRRVLFTGLFDTGKQGKEWPGSFEIDQKKGYFWHAAKSVPHPDRKDLNWIKLGLRGNRPVGDSTFMSVMYKIDGADSFDVEVIGKTFLDSPYSCKMPIRGPKLKAGQWMGVLNVDLDDPSFLKKDRDSIKEVIFTVPRAATLWIDDLLLYEPGQKPAGLQHKKALIIGIDGCRPDALLAAKAPNLHGLIKNGAFSDKAQTGDMTASGSGWGSLLTGVWREKHGVRGNDFKRANFVEFPDLLFRTKKAQPERFVASIVHWEPIKKQIVQRADVTTAHKTDAEVVKAATQLLKDKNPDILFVHLDDVDGAGHKFGFDPKLPRYLDAIEKADEQVGALLKALAERSTYAKEDWLIVVSTDHGGKGKGHGNNTPEERTIFLIVSGKSAARGTIEPAPNIVDVAPTVLQHLGIAIEEKWGFDGKAVGLKAAKEMCE